MSLLLLGGGGFSAAAGSARPLSNPLINMQPTPYNACAGNARLGFLALLLHGLLPWMWPPQGALEAAHVGGMEGSELLDACRWEGLKAGSRASWCAP